MLCQKIPQIKLKIIISSSNNIKPQDGGNSYVYLYTFCNYCFCFPMSATFYIVTRFVLKTQGGHHYYLHFTHDDTEVQTYQLLAQDYRTSTIRWQSWDGSKWSPLITTLHKRKHRLKLHRREKLARLQLQKLKYIGLVWWHMPIALPLERIRQKDYKFNGSLG